jgi:hypothetical protein
MALLTVLASQPSTTHLVNVFPRGTLAEWRRLVLKRLTAHSPQ